MELEYLASLNFNVIIHNSINVQNGTIGSGRFGRLNNAASRRAIVSRPVDTLEKVVRALEREIEHNRLLWQC